MAETDNNSLLEKAYSALILRLGDKVLRKVSKEKTVDALWKKLKEIYMTKTLASRLCLKQALYSFKMVEEKNIEEQVDIFNKLILDLENIGTTISDENQALLLQCSLPKSYNNFKETLMLGRDDLKLYDVQTALSSRQLSIRKEVDKVHSQAESLNVKGRPHKRETKKGNNPSRLKSKTKIKCYYCHEEGRIRRNCPR